MATVTEGSEALDLIDALDHFLETFVEPLEFQHSDVLGDPRERYRSSGILSESVLEVKRQVRTAAASIGLYGLMVPEDLGGRGLGGRLQYAIWRHLYCRCGPERILPYDTIGTFTSGPGAALHQLSSRARQEIWPEILSGEKVLCFALTEPAGSDHRQVRTAVTSGKRGYLLNGEKAWVSRGGYADYALVYAVREKSDPAGAFASSAFLVPLASPGVGISSVVRLLGRVGGEEVTLRFEDVQLSEWQLVGGLDGGAAVARGGALATALFTAGRFVGLAKWAIDRSARVVQSAGSSVSDATAQRMLAESLVEVEGVDLLARDCAAGADSGRDTSHAQAILRLTAPETCGRVFERAMWLHGSEGLTNEARLFDGWHQSRIVQVAQSAQVDRMYEAISASTPRPGARPDRDPTHDS